jgi:hypothetical protein
MTSAIDPTKPADGLPASKGELRANLQAAKTEIEALQTEVVAIGRLAISNRTSATVTLATTDERNYLVLQAGVASLAVSTSIALGAIINGVNESGGTVTIVATPGGSTTFAGPTAIPHDAPFSLIKTASAKVRVIVGG